MWLQVGAADRHRAARGCAGGLQARYVGASPPGGRPRAAEVRLARRLSRGRRPRDRWPDADDPGIDADAAAWARAPGRLETSRRQAAERPEGRSAPASPRACQPRARAPGCGAAGGAQLPALEDRVEVEAGHPGATRHGYRRSPGVPVRCSVARPSGAASRAVRAPGWRGAAAERVRPRDRGRALRAEASSGWPGAARMRALTGPRTGP